MCECSTFWLTVNPLRNPLPGGTKSSTAAWEWAIPISHGSHRAHHGLFQATLRPVPRELKPAAAHRLTTAQRERQDAGGSGEGISTASLGDTHSVEFCGPHPTSWALPGTSWSQRPSATTLWQDPHWVKLWCSPHHRVTQHRKRRKNAVAEDDYFRVIHLFPCTTVIISVSFRSLWKPPPCCQLSELPSSSHSRSSSSFLYMYFQSFH